MSTRRPVADRREQLIDAALEVAARDGVPAATIRRVAATAGVSLGVVHYCFSSKDDLFVQMARRIVTDSVRATTAVLSDLSAMSGSAPEFRVLLGAATDALWANIVQTPGRQLLTYEITTHALRQSDLAEVAQRQYESSEAGVVQFLDLVAEAVQVTWVRPTVRLAGSVLAYIDGVTLRWLVDGDVAAGRERLDDIVDYLLIMVAR